MHANCPRGKLVFQVIDFSETFRKMIKLREMAWNTIRQFLRSVQYKYCDYEAYYFTRQKYTFLLQPTLLHRRATGSPDLPAMANVSLLPDRDAVGLRRGDARTLEEHVDKWAARKVLPRPCPPLRAAFPHWCAQSSKGFEFTASILYRDDCFDRLVLLHGISTWLKRVVSLWRRRWGGGIEILKQMGFWIVVLFLHSRNIAAKNVSVTSFG